MPQKAICNLLRQLPPHGLSGTRGKPLFFFFFFFFFLVICPSASSAFSCFILICPARAQRSPPATSTESEESGGVSERWKRTNSGVCALGLLFPRGFGRTVAVPYFCNGAPLDAYFVFRHLHTPLLSPFSADGPPLSQIQSGGPAYLTHPFPSPSPLIASTLGRGPSYLVPLSVACAAENLSRPVSPEWAHHACSSARPQKRPKLKEGKKKREEEIRHGCPTCILYLFYFLFPFALSHSLFVVTRPLILSPTQRTPSQKPISHTPPRSPLQSTSLTLQLALPSHSSFLFLPPTCHSTHLFPEKTQAASFLFPFFF